VVLLLLLDLHGQTSVIFGSKVGHYLG